MKLRVIFFGFLLFASLSPVFSQSKKQQQLEERRQLILNEIKQINSLLFKTQGQKKTVLTEVEDLDQRIKAQENLIRVTNQQANLLTREINENTTQISNLRAELTELKDDYAAMVRKSYKSKSQQSRIMFLLSSQDFLQAYKRVQYMKQYANHRKKQGESIKEKTILLQDLNQGLIDQRKQKDKLIAENKVAKANLNKEKKNQEALIATLKKDETGFASQIRSKQNEADKLNKEIKAIIRAVIAEANKKAAGSSTVKPKASLSGGFALTPEAAALAKNFSNNKGKLIWPVEKGVVLNRYGTRQHPQFPNVTQIFHGVEIATSKDAKARAIFEGEVVQIQQVKNANKAVYIKHGDYITIYNNLASVSVKKGDKVSAKDNLGTIFTHPTTGKTVIKFLVYKNSTEMNPADWIYRM
ncbi:peptidase M23 [Patiriisocius marinistellae]|uniref:Peptidase M23 n=1 Tax=Patiriisocius marinistellae TaxID=2494560 RepID=A0A5J4FSA9_9FLAO|nr:peptidoglycan DD-metalloendopeptidase family protein [Patiriisocius marinistellae]GEQ84817.1 peptidase M23 [Patiriisocius marinistellae]